MVFANRTKVFFLLFLSGLLFLSAAPCSGADLEILILHSYHQEYPWTKKENDAIVATLKAKFAEKELAFSTEYLDSKRIPLTPEYLDFFKNYLQYKYSERSPDLVFLTDDSAVRFMLEYNDELFGDVPKVFSGVNDRSLENVLQGTTIHGVFEVKNIQGNLRLIKRLFPSAVNIFVIGDNSETYQAIKKNLHSHLEKNIPGQKVQYLADKSLAKVLIELESEAPDVVLLTTIGAFAGEDGRTISLPLAIERIRQAGDYAIISMEDAYIMDGVFGGIVSSGSGQGVAAASMGHRLLSKETATDEEEQFELGPNVPTFTFRDMQRLGIELNQLPSDSLVIGRPPSLFDEFKEVVLANIIAFVLLLLLVISLSWSIVRRTKAEKNLLASEYFLSSVLENLPDLVFVKDADNLKFVKVNKTAERYFGRSKEDIIGKSDYDFFPQDEADFFTKKDRETLTSKEEVTIPLEKIQTQEGRRYLSTKKIPILGANRQALYLLGISRDVTDEINAAKNRQELENRLQQSQKMEAIGTLAGGIAHDFNNILSSVIGYTELAQHKADYPEEVRSLLEGTLKGAERARLLIRQILTFSRKDEHQLRAVAMAELLQDALILLRSTLPSSVVIEEHISGRCAVMANSTQIHQIIINLGTNGYQAMEEHTGELVFRLDEEEFETPSSLPLGEMQTGKYVHFSVEDDGCGMNEKTQKRIFEPYFTTKGSTSGTGLGLAVVHGIVKSHGGYITVSSQLGIGSRIDIYLPAFEGEVEHISDTSSEGNIIGGDESILLVDDEPDITKMMGKYLSIFGYKVAIFTNSKEALAEYEKNHGNYDLVITDMTMPEMTGAELSQRMLEITPDLPIILCTGHSEDIDRERASAIGIRKYYEKPITIDGLLTKIRELLDS